MSSISITRKDFIAEVAKNPINVADAKLDPRLEGVDFDKIDTNNDGKISGTSEAGKLFDEIDRVDNDKNANTVLISRKDVANEPVQKKIAAVGDLSKSAKLQRLAHAHEDGNDDVIFIGMRTVNKLESDALKKAGKANGYEVTVIGGKDDGTIKYDGDTYDLKTNAGIRDFAQSLALPKDQEDGVVRALEMTPANGRNELAQLALIWAKAEDGGKVPSRLILSGHSSNGNFAGENGSLVSGGLNELAHALPKGAAQVEDLHLAGCYGNGQGTARDMREAFPNVKTIWGYDQTAPTSDGGAVKAQKIWDEATRGRVGILDRKLAKNTTHGDEVITWSAQGGFQAARPQKSLEDAKKDVAKNDKYDLYFDGDRNVGNPHSGKLREYYNALNDLADHPDLPASEKPAIKDKIDHTIRLLYFGDMAREWSAANKQLISDGYKAAGAGTAPDFSKMNREQAVTAIQSFFEKTKDSKDPTVLDLRKKMTDLYLEPKALPLDWVQ